MLIIADDKIPGLEDAFGEHAQVHRMAGEAISKSQLRNADALVVRTVTKVDKDLIDGSGLRLVASATAGTDHVDLTTLESAGIAFAHAPGANAPAVCDYVLAAVFELANRTGTDPFEMTFGIVGVGNVGGRLAKRLESLGIRVLLSDPPREENEESLESDPRFVPLDNLLAESDVVTLHVPLTDTGAHPTTDILSSKRLGALRDGAWLINTCRGGVVDEGALADSTERSSLSSIVDVWIGEPRPDIRLVASSAISTPHIAGYGRQSKDRATQAVVTAIREVFDLPAEPPSDDGRTRLLPIVPPPDDVSDVEFCASLMRQAYDIRVDHLRMQGLASFPASGRVALFRELRRGYRFRDEFSAHTIDTSGLSSRQMDLAAAIGFDLGQ